MDKEKKKKIGIMVYYSSLVISVIVLFLILFFFNTEDKELIYFTRYAVCFYCFGGFISLGLICREYCIEEYNKKKLLIKLIVTFLLNVIVTVLLIVFPMEVVALCSFIAGVALLMYVIVPTNPKENNTQNK